MSVCNQNGFNAWWMKFESVLVAVRDQVHHHGSVVFLFFTFLCSCSRLLVAWSAM